MTNTKAVTIGAVHTHTHTHTHTHYCLQNKIKEINKNNKIRDGNKT